jgi:hypothetical protein
LWIWSDFDRASSLICGNKMPTRCNRCFLLQILLLAQHDSGTIMPIIRSSRAARKRDTQPSALHHTNNLKTKAPNTTGSNRLYNTLELLMMGIIVPETCGASNKICNKKHLLRLVGILFPHITLVCSFPCTDITISHKKWLMHPLLLTPLYYHCFTPTCFSSQRAIFREYDWYISIKCVTRCKILEVRTYLQVKLQ